MLSQSQPDKYIRKKIKEVLQHATTFIFDVDGTLAERQQLVSPELALALRNSGKSLGVATSRALNELDEVFDGCGLTRAQLIKGPVVIEDGGLVIKPNSELPELKVQLAQCQAVFTLKEHILKHIKSNANSNTWSQLDEISFPLVHVPLSYDYRTSLSIWQQVVDEKPQHLERVMNWCQNVVTELGLQNLVQLIEIGDGTLRISVPGRSKGVALQELHEEGQINLAHSVYFGDGMNDVPAAEVVRKHGGHVIAVDIQCKALLEYANFTTPKHGPQGILELLTSINNA